MQDTQDIYTKLVQIISETIRTDKDKITADATFDSLGIDSIDRLEIIMKVEDQFGIEISDEDAANMSSLKDAVEKINSLKNKIA